MDEETFLMGYNNSMTPVKQCHMFGMLCKEAGVFDFPDDWFVEISNAPMSKEASADDILYLSFIDGYTEKIAQGPDTTVPKKPMGTQVQLGATPTSTAGNVWNMATSTPLGKQLKRWGSGAKSKAISMAGDYASRNPQEVQKWLAENPEFVKQQATTYMKANPEFVKQQAMAYFKQNPQQAQSMIGEYAKTMTPQQLQSIYKQIPQNVRSQFQQSQMSQSIMPMIKKYLPWLAIGGGALMGLSGIGGRGRQGGGYPPPMYGRPMMQQPPAWRGLF